METTAITYKHNKRLVILLSPEKSSQAVSIIGDQLKNKPLVCSSPCQEKRPTENSNTPEQNKPRRKSTENSNTPEQNKPRRKSTENSNTPDQNKPRRKSTENSNTPEQNKPRRRSTENSNTPDQNKPRRKSTRSRKPKMRMDDFAVSTSRATSLRVSPTKARSICTKEKSTALILTGPTGNDPSQTHGSSKQNVPSSKIVSNGPSQTHASSKQNVSSYKIVSKDPLNSHGSSKQNVSSSKTASNNRLHSHGSSKKNISPSELASSGDICLSSKGSCFKLGKEKMDVISDVSPKKFNIVTDTSTETKVYSYKKSINGKPAENGLPSGFVENKVYLPNSLDGQSTGTELGSGTVNVSGTLSSDNDNTIISMRDGNRCLIELSLVLQIDKMKEYESPMYRDFVLAIITASRHHPYHGSLREEMDATLTYDYEGQLVIIEVPYIKAGIFQVTNIGPLHPHDAFEGAYLQPVKLYLRKSIDEMSPDSKFIILGDLYQIPSTSSIQNNYCPWQERLGNFLESKTFQNFILPLLLGHGEPNSWGNIPGCKDAQPVFLKRQLDNDKWRWCQYVDIPDLYWTPQTELTPIEPSDGIPDNVPLCQYIYQTYITGKPCRLKERNPPEVTDSKSPPYCKASVSPSIEFKNSSPMSKKAKLICNKNPEYNSKPLVSNDVKVAEDKNRAKKENQTLKVSVKSLCGKR